MRVDYTELEKRHLAEDLGIDPDSVHDVDYDITIYDSGRYNRDEYVETPWTRVAVLPKFKYRENPPWMRAEAEGYFFSKFGRLIIGRLFETARYYCARVLVPSKCRWEQPFHKPTILETTGIAGAVQKLKDLRNATERTKPE